MWVPMACLDEWRDGGGVIDCWLQWMMGPWGIFDWVARELGKHFMQGVGSFGAYSS